jgi:hypothetical protein
VVATSDVLNALNGGLGRLSRRPLWVGALAFLLFTAVGVVALMSVAIGVLATLRVAYTTSIGRVSNVAPPTDQRLADRASRSQTVMPISPVVLPHVVPARAEGGTEPSSATLPRNDPTAPETPQPAAGATKPDAATTSARPAEDPARSTLTELIEAQSQPTPPARAASDSDNQGRPNGPTVSPAGAASGATAAATSASDATPATPVAPSTASPPATDVASTAGAPETDEIGRLATAPLPIEVTAAALSHLRRALKRRSQARAIKHTGHKPAPPPSRAAPQNNSYRPFDPFQPAAPSTAATTARQNSW